MSSSEGKRSVVLFDLDGTISDSERSILTAVRGAFVAHGIPPLTAEQERTILGPPFYEVLPPFIGDVPVLDVIASYRKIYVEDGAMYDTEVFVGMANLVESAAAAHRATSSRKMSGSVWRWAGLPSSESSRVTATN